MKNKTGKVIFFLIYLIFLLQVFIPVVNAQTPTPPTRDSLILAIQQRAQKDVELGAAPQSPTDLAVLFSEQASSVGMSINEVKDIYDEAYKNAIPVKSPWDDLLKPQGGWIFLIIGALLVILANIAKDYLTAFGKKLAEAAYQQLARFRLFWGIALRRYRRSLEATYSELKIPFRAGRPLEMKDVYVPVRVDGGDKKQVDAYQTIQNQKRLVVLGDPGSGKTMFLRHVAFTYARQGLDDFQGQPVPVYLELNRVESAGGALFAALTKTLENHNFPGAEGFLKSALENHALLILLDGLDEVNAAARPALVKQIQDLDQKHAGNRIIITCRKAVYQGELDAWVDGKLEIVEFSDQQIQRFMTSWQKDMPAEKSIEHFFRTLQERPQIMSLARNPLLLTMVAYLYTDTEFALPHSRSEFYSRSTDLLLDQWKLERNRYKATHKRIVLQRLALFNQSQVGKMGERRTLELADVLREIRAVLPDLTLKTEDAQPLLDEIVQRSGLMLVIDGGTCYQFTHLTLQEYFAARALETDQKKLLDFYSATPDAWREVVRLWCALEHDSTAMLKDLCTLDPVMAFECLSDAQQVDSAYADELIESFKPRLHEALTNDSLASAFALLAADPRPRGRKWFKFVEGNLGDEDKHLTACTVLARTNIPQAAESLAKFALTDPSVILFLVQLGNLAVPALTEPAKNGEVWAMDALVDIGTPQAALALEFLLWTDEPKAYHAVWRLAALLPLTGAEDILQTVNLTSEQRKAKQIEWVWEPFSDHATLRAIVGRIAYLLHMTPEEFLPKKKLPCDPRLTISLCGIASQDGRIKKMSKERIQELQEQIGEDIKTRLISFKAKLLHEPMDEQMQKSMVEEFTHDISDNHVWKYLYSMLSIPNQFTLLLTLAHEKIKPSIDDWHNLFKPISYDFPRSWHVKVLKFLLLIPIFLDFWGMGLIISQSSSLLTQINVGIFLLGVALLVMTIWIQRAHWRLVDLDGLLSVTFFLAGGIFGIIIGELTNSWVTGSVVGFIVGATVGITLFIGDGGTGVAANRIGVASGVGVFIGVVSSIIGGIGVILASSGVVVVVIVVASVVIIGYAVGIAFGTGVGEISFGVIGFGVIIFFGGTFVYFATDLLYDWIGLSAVFLFWTIWLSTFALMYLIAKRLDRRAQNPLQGLLEVSPSANKSMNKRITMVAQLFGWRE
ncbi:MAG: NACHT domain-containing protein [Anaerolineales bacterium]